LTGVADVNVELRWQVEKLRFRGRREGGPEITIDGDSVDGPSPMSTLLLSLGGCMGADIVDIATKMRLPITDFELRIEGDRRPEPPRRYTALRMTCIVSGVDEADRPKVLRAIELSRETYCSVIHSLRQDIQFSIDLEMR
jgi:putative redox protein